MATALDSGYLRVARTHQRSELLLTEAPIHPVLDQQPRDLAAARKGLPLLQVLRTLGGATVGSLLRRGTHGACGVGPLQRVASGVTDMAQGYQF